VSEENARTPACAPPTASYHVAAVRRLAWIASAVSIALGPPACGTPSATSSDAGTPIDAHARDGGDGAPDAAPAVDAGAPGRSDCEDVATGRARCVVLGAAGWGAGALEGVRVDDSGRLTLSSEGRTSGTDTRGVYNGGSYEYGSFTSAELAAPIAFDGAVPSWIATTPPGTWISVQARARVGSTWTAWYRLGVWASGTTDVRRHSFDGESDAYGEVATDTVLLGSAADAIRVRVTLFTADGSSSPTVERLTLALADRSMFGADEGGTAWGTILDVPGRSQMLYPDGGEVWCSPTSTSMLLAYWSARTSDSALDVTVPAAASGTYDTVYGGNGNWPFNIAYAGSLGLVGEVAWFSSMSDLEPLVARGIPVALSAAWEAGDIDGAAISSTAGHLLVVRGFDADGNVAVNDPAAATNAGVDRIYDRAQLAGAWLGGSGGVAYVLWSPDTAP